eukprot:scaffold26504_cov228-Skeletonema_dohrnii-CCMP3373.AAC.9
MEQRSDAWPCERVYGLSGSIEFQTGHNAPRPDGRDFDATPTRTIKTQNTILVAIDEKISGGGVVCQDASSST